jgi:hypothetical protein
MRAVQDQRSEPPVWVEIGHSLAVKTLGTSPTMAARISKVGCSRRRISWR